MVKGLKRLWGDWEGFLYKQVDARPLAWLRCGLGVYLIWYYVWYYPFANLHFFPPAITPPPYYQGAPWLLINYVPYKTWALGAAYGVTFVAALGLALGFWTRLCAALSWAAFASWLSVPVGRNGGDVVLAALCFLMLVASVPGHAQATFALDAPSRFKRSPRLLIPAWSLRLFQIQLVLIYFTTGFHKSASWVWYRGEAMYYVFQQAVWLRWDASWFTNPVAVGLLTYGVLIWELFLFPLLVWPKSTRHFMLLSGVLFHFGIALVMRVYVFGEAMLLCYLSFVDADWFEAGLRRLAHVGRGVPRERVPEVCPPEDQGNSA
jgi:hypothetical protein